MDFPAMSYRFLTATINCLFVITAVLSSSMTASAQVGRDSDWRTPDGDLRIYVSPSTQYPRDNWRTGNGPRRDIGDRASVEMQGSYRNLRWTGEYWIMGVRNHQPRRGCVASKPNGYSSADDAFDYGTFDITFNAAENSFTGTRQWVCRFADGRVRNGPLETITGTRAGITAAIRPTARVPSLGTPSSTPPPGTGGGVAPRPSPTGGNDRIVELSIISDGGREQLIPFSQRYKIRPDIIDALTGQKFQVDLIAPEGKRPMRLSLREFLLQEVRPASDPSNNRLVGRFTNETVAMGLPFVGDPRPGSSIMNRTMPAGFCSSPIWIASLDFSDGTKSEPFAALISSCGMRLHPEKLPRRGAVENLKPIER